MDSDEALLLSTKKGYLPGLICVADANTGYFTECNTAVTSILGISVEEFISRPFMEFIHPEDRQITIDEISNQLKGSPVVGFENRYQCKDGSYRWLEWQATAADKDAKVHAVATDITERKEVEEELRLHSQIMKNVSEGIYLVGLDDERIKYTNPKFGKMFGYDPGEMIGREVSMVNAPTEKTPEETKKQIIDVLVKTGEWHGEVKNIKKDGTHFWCYANVSLFDHPTFGRVAVSVHTDVTDRKKAEEELIIAREKAEESEEKLKVRVKELNCFYNIGNIVNANGVTLDNILNEILYVIPESLQYPEIINARIVLNDEKHQTEDFIETKWKLKENIIVNGKIKGYLEVNYSENRAPDNVSVFLKEEEFLIKAIAGRLGRIIEKYELENVLKSLKRARKL